MKQINIDSNAIVGILAALAQDFPYPPGSDKASPFKKVAAFTANFVAAKPIQTPFPVEQFGTMATKQNAIIAYALSIDALHGAELQRRDGKKIILTERIVVSHHYWQDLITVIQDCVLSQHFQMLSLVYESLAYRWNPTASYEPTV
jgi:hypothetical protein